MTARTLLLLFLTVIFTAPALAQEGVADCGRPDAPVLETDPGFQFCDLHARRFEYKDSRDEFRGLIDARRENFHAPAAAARADYRARLEALHSRQDAYNQ